MKAKFYKYLAFIINILIIICGILKIIAGGLINGESEKFHKVAGDQDYEFEAIFLIISGLALIIIYIILCFATYKVKKELLLLNAILLPVLFLIIIMDGVISVVFERTENGIVVDFLQDSINKYHFDDGIKSKWDYIQSTEKCCGYFHHSDWTKNEKLQIQASVPMSCCKIDNIKICNETANNNKFWESGCFTQFRGGADLIFCIFIILCFLSPCGFGITMVLVNSIKT